MNVTKENALETRLFITGTDLQKQAKQFTNNVDFTIIKLNNISKSLDTENTTEIVREISSLEYEINLLNERFKRLKETAQKHEAVTEIYNYLNSF